VNSRADLYVLDFDTSRLQLVSIRPGRADAYSGFFSPGISADGRYLVFEALTADDASPDKLRWEVLILDRGSGAAQVVRPQDSAARERRQNRAPALSADGQTVAFESIQMSSATGQIRSVSDARETL
jgi:Tol biopolymer transport system component